MKHPVPTDSWWLLKARLLFLLCLLWLPLAWAVDDDDDSAFVGPPAPKPEPNTPVLVQQTAKSVEEATRQLEALDAWLYDLEAVEAGEVPEGFVLAPPDDYLSDPTPRCPVARARWEEARAAFHKEQASEPKSKK